jgi:hypothetical protein
MLSVISDWDLVGEGGTDLRIALAEPCVLLLRNWMGWDWAVQGWASGDFAGLECWMCLQTKLGVAWGSELGLNRCLDRRECHALIWGH